MFSLQGGYLSEEQLSGIITLIPKKCHDRTNLSNLRPITLLNADFKIFSKVVANRTQLGIHGVVHNDQTGFVRGRSIATKINNIPMVIDHTRSSESTGLLLVDYRKAFDTVRLENSSCDSSHDHSSRDGTFRIWRAYMFGC